MSNVPYLTLNDGNQIPQFGLGVWQVPNSKAADAIRTAIQAGYRSVDTAALYRNEPGVGDAVAAADVPREELFITTKLWGSDQATTPPCVASMTASPGSGWSTSTCT